MLKSSTSSYSRYISTTWKLSATQVFRLPTIDVSVRPFSVREAVELAERAERSNPFVRRPYGNPFYLNRIQGLGNRTVIEIFKDGLPAQIYPSLQTLALVIEDTIVLSSILSINRSRLHQLLAIEEDKGPNHDIAIAPRFRSFRSRSRRDRSPSGIPVDGRFIRRFNNNGFPNLLHYRQSGSDLSRKLDRCLRWLSDSRTEPNFHAAVVKTSVALEALLIFNDNEPLTRSLAQRMAYLISDKPETRAALDRKVRDFYDARSSIVHGGRRKSERLSPKLLESVDRLILCACLVIAANHSKWPSRDSLRDWCDAQQWSSPDSQVVVPFSDRYLRSSLSPVNND